MSEQAYHILSIDIGIKNLGWAIIEFNKLGKKVLEDLSITFNIYDISKHLPKRKDIVSGRCEALLQFFQPLFAKYNSFKTIIIERQVNRNTMAMELMYAITMAIKILNGPNSEIIIFDPKDKFLKLGLEYSTKNKAHKKQSILYAHKLVESYWSDLLPTFNDFEKKDDISDALNQALVWMVHNGYLNYSVDEYVELIN